MENNPEKDHKNKLLFPAGFLWGSATSAHQVEGGTNNQWTQWEKDNAQRLADEAKTKWQPWQQQQFPEMFEKENYISGQACDHYNRYEQDFDIVKELGQNAHRFSIEWSRIEPEEGKFDEKEIEHYRKVLLALRERGIEPFVTLWHWTEPIWFNEQGGWTNKKSQAYFVRFVEKVVSEYKDLAKFWILVNEPNVGLGYGYYLGAQPPARKKLANFLRAYFNMLHAYKKGYVKIHAINKKAKVGFAHSHYLYKVDFFKPLDGLISKAVTFFSNYFPRSVGGFQDFIGCNYYQEIFLSLKKKDASATSDLGWRFYPEGIYRVLMNLKKYNLPIYITENGLADAKDEKRKEFIATHLKWMHKAIEDGADVRGYFHWSLLDNFEFPEVRGFWPRFGLVEVDFKTQQRKIRQSALEYATICKNNALDVE